MKSLLISTLTLILAVQSHTAATEPARRDVQASTGSGVAAEAQAKSTETLCCGENKKVELDSYLSCAVFPIGAVEGGILHYCDVFETSCNDIPEEGYRVFQGYKYTSDCPTGLNCLNFTLKELRKAATPTIQMKSPNISLPDGLNPNFRVLRSGIGVFHPTDAKTVYVRLFHLLLHYPEYPQINQSIKIAYETETPKKTDGLQLFKRDGDDPNRIKLGAQSILVLLTKESMPAVKE